MINPTEYSTLLINVKLSLCKYSDSFVYKRDYGIATHKDKIRLAILDIYFYYLNKARINPINANAEILPCRGQLPELDTISGNLVGLKQYDETVILKSIKRINQILKTGYTLKIYEDKYLSLN